MKKKRKEQRNQKGITLIALVITIVILIILATISIQAVFSDGGIIKQAEKASDKYKQGQQNEVEGMQELLDKINKIIRVDREIRVLQDRDTDWEGNVYYDIYVVPKNGYVSVLEFLVREKLDNIQKENVAWMLTAEGSIEFFLEIQKDFLKDNNLTLSEFCKINGTTVDDILSDEFCMGWNGLAFEMYLLFDKLDQTLKENVVMSYYQQEINAEANNINEAISYLFGEESTVNGLATKYNCSEGLIIDLAFSQVQEKIEDNELKERIDSDTNIIMQELANEIQNFENKGKVMTVILPDGTEKTTNETIRYSIRENGTYVFKVTCDGETKDFTFNINDIESTGSID